LFALIAAVLSMRAADGDEAGRPVFRNFRPTEYRGDPQVYAVALTPDGLVYLSNAQGVIEYDGVRWRHLPAPTSATFNLDAGSDGRVWLGGMDEIGYYAADTAGGARVYHSITAQLPPALRSPGRVRSVIARPEGVYFSVPRHVFRWRDGVVRDWPLGTRPIKLHPVGNDLYAHVAGTGLLRLVGDEFQLVSTDAAFLTSNESAIFALDRDHVLAAIANAGFFTVDLTTGALTPWATPVNTLLRAASIPAGVRLPDGSFALGTLPFGLLIISPDGMRFRRLDRTTGLVDNVVLGLAPDPAGGLWVGFNTGAARVELDSPVSVFDGDNGPPSGTIDCWGHYDGALYAGAFDGLWRLTPSDPATGAGARFVKDPRSITNVFAIQPFEGETLVSTTAGLYRMTSGGDGVEQLVDSILNHPLCVIASRVTPGRFYLGGTRGLTVVQKTPAGWTKLAEFLELGDIHTATEQTDGTLWLASYSRGFWEIPRAGEISDWTQVKPRQFLKNCGLPEVILSTAVFDSSGGVSLFTDKGSFRLDASGTRCIPDDRFPIPGEPRTAVYPFEHAANGDGWASVFTTGTRETNYPLGRFVPTTDGPRWLPAPPAAIAEIGFAGAIVMAIDRSPNGEEVLWARGNNNTVRLALGHPPATPAAWRAVIRELDADGREQVLPAANTTLRLPFSREPLRFALAAPSYGTGGEVRFSTRLLGYSDKWSEPNERPEVVFTNLEGGPFTLEVRAHSAEGRVSEPAALRFSVAPPWQRTPVAYSLYVLAAVGGMTGFIRWRLGRTAREQRRLETLVVLRTSELATARDQAEAASRAKSSFLASMSHELRTPLNGVIGYAQVLQDDRRLLPDQRERLRIVQHSGEHLLRMINDVLDLAKIEAGKLELRNMPFVLRELVRDTADLHAPAAAAKRLALDISVAAELPAWVTGDSQKIRQILDNLLGNAVKFTLSGTVTLRATRAADQHDGDGIGFAVADTGPGIDAADQTRLFQPFEQATRRRPNAPGAGLGLAVSRALVERLGGTLTLDSHPGRGSTFGFVVPLPAVAPDPILAGRGNRRVGYEGVPRRVLLVDDHTVNLSLLTDLLTPLGFSCREFGSGEAALDHLEREAVPWPDLAILDVRMAGLDGLELTRRIRALPRGSALKILLTSASVLTFDPEEGRAAGCDDFLPKPFRSVELLDKIGALLGLRWRETGSQSPFATAHVPLPPDVREVLREHLARGDLDAFRAALTAAAAAHPAAEARWAEIEAAAAAFELSRLRLLLDQS
jgi:signal transduction histidine kinase/DNA-binding response OmpR family regulator